MDRPSDASEPQAGGPQRVDKWVWHARVVKTRGLAQKLVEAGLVRKNRERVEQSSETVKPGDVLTITLSHRILVMKVTGFAGRRGSAPEARRLYEDLSPPPPPRDPAPGPVAPTREPGTGRPTKRERRRMEAFGREAEED